MALENIFDKLLVPKRENQILFFLLTIGFIVRILGFTEKPLGLNQDEASIGYEAFSLLKTGFDRNGISFPIHFISWGSGQNALYAYLSMPFISIFGLNVFSARIVNVIFSCVSLIIFYLLFKLIFNKKKALIALALLSICPWSIMAARWGLESNIFPTLFLIAFYFLFKGILIAKKFFILSFFVFATSLYSYGTSYLVVPLFIIIASIYLLKNRLISLKYFLISSTVFLIVSLPVISFIIINHFNLSQLELFNITVPKLSSNRINVIFNLFSVDILKLLPQNLLRLLNIIVVQSDGNLYNAIPYFGTIYVLSLPFFIIGFYNVIVNKKYKTDASHFLFCIWFLCSIILGLSSHININRLNIIFFPLLYFVVLGIIDAGNAIKPQLRKNYFILVSSLYFISFVFFIGYYFIFVSGKINENYNSGLGDAIQYAENLNHTDTINISSKTVNMPYIYVCFYTRLNPETFRKDVEYETNNNSVGFRNVLKLGRYIFESEIDSPKTIYILSNQELKYKDKPFYLLKKFDDFSVIRYISNANNQLKVL